MFQTLDYEISTMIMWIEYQYLAFSFFRYEYNTIIRTYYYMFIYVRVHYILYNMLHKYKKVTKEN